MGHEADVPTEEQNHAWDVPRFLAARISTPAFLRDASSQAPGSCRLREGSSHTRRKRVRGKGLALRGSHTSTLDLPSEGYSRAGRSLQKGESVRPRTNAVDLFGPGFRRLDPQCWRGPRQVRQAATIRRALPEQKGPCGRPTGAPG